MRNRSIEFSRMIGTLAIVVGLLVCTAGAAEIPSAPAGTFSVVALPDTQAYSANQPDAFYAEMQWILANRKAQRIVFVSHLGDIVDKNVPVQWEVAKRAMSMLDGRVPYGLCVGNHDMACAEGDASLFSTYFPAKHFEGRPWYVGQIKNNVNSAQTFEAEGLKFVVVHVECNAPDDVLAWVDKVLTAHANRRAIVTTHMLLGPLERPKTKEGWYEDPKGFMRWHKCHGPRGNSPEQLWEKCFRRHKNVFLILGGDQSRTQSMHLELTGKHGNCVHVCMSDYREGYFRIYRFLPEQNQIRVMTYSAIKRALCPGSKIVGDPAKHQFVLSYRMTSGE